MLDSFLIKLLNHYSMSCQDLDARMSTGSFVDLKRPDQLPDFKKLISFLKSVKEKGEKLVIYGDYDVDGITSTAILKKTFDSIGIKTGYFIPSRYKEGYGLSLSRVEEFYQKGYKHILTVDNGIRAFDAIDKAYELGMDVIIIDHHEADTTLPRCEALFHHKISDFLSYNCSACSLSYFVASALLERDDEYFALLAGLAVFSDVMPVIENNLVFAKLALNGLRTHRYKQFEALLRYKRDISYHDMNFTIVPALNSPGRLYSESKIPNLVCKFLLSENPSEINELARFILETNKKRKEAVKKIGIDAKNVYETSHGLALKVDALSGLSGLIANKLMREKDEPVMVMMDDEKDMENIISSIRTPSHINANSFIEKNPTLFINAGGHKNACGATFKKSNLLKVVTLFLSEMEKAYLSSDMKVDDDRPIIIELDDICERNFETLLKFAPFGNGLESPVFQITLSTCDLMPSKNNKCVFAYRGNSKDHLVCFTDPDELLKHGERTITFIGELEKETFRNESRIVLKASQYSLN